ncbi:Zinc fingers and homeoboxes protein 2 [Aix galericulata]|nr:Zinc fingers and homeoboxes protein 2 [Aix galericulata]
MFNGTIQAVPQTITVLPAPLATAKIPPPIIQTALPCQILGQTGLVLTPVSNGSAVSCSPITLAVAPNQGQKRTIQTLASVPEAKRPHVVQVPESPAKLTAVPLTPASERKKTKEQIAELKASFIASQFPDDTEVYRLIEATGLSRSEIKKWFSDHRYRRQRGIVHVTGDALGKDQIAPSLGRHGRSFHPYADFAPQKFKEKTQEQLRALEESFLRCSFPTQGELDRLRVETKLSRREIDSWFSERRKIRDSMEQAEHKKLNEENAGKTVVRAKRDCEPLKDSLLGNQAEGAERLECNSHDGHGSEENEEPAEVNWVEVTVGEDDAASDCTDSWSQAAPEGQAELADFDSESISGDNAHV